MHMKTMKIYFEVLEILNEVHSAIQRWNSYYSNANTLNVSKPGIDLNIHTNFNS